MSKSKIKLSPSFRESEKNFGWTEEQIRQLELDMLKHQDAEAKRRKESECGENI